MAMRVLPLAVDNLEGNILIRWSSMETEDAKVLVVRARLQEVLRRGAFVDQVRVKDIELVALHDLGRWIVKVIMRLVVFVPLEAGVHAVEEARFTWPILVCPEIHLAREWHLHTELGLVSTHALFGTPHKRIFCVVIGIT